MAPDGRMSLRSMSLQIKMRTTRCVTTGKLEKSLQNKIEIFVPDRQMTVYSLKSLLQKQTGLPAGAQRLVHEGRDLQDWNTLETVGVLPHDDVILTRR